jgi:hypothetical protein
MGGGRTEKDELLKAEVHLLADMPTIGGSVNASVAEAGFCAAPPFVPFTVEPGTSVTIDAPVRVVSDADPMPVMSGNRKVGVVDDTFAVALRGCMADGFKYAGRIHSLNLDATAGMLAVRGSLKDDA